MHSEITSHQLLEDELNNSYDNLEELPHAPVYDKNGIELHDGDIVAESEVGKLIWDDTCQIIKQPLGKVKIYDDGRVNIILYEPGKIKAIKDISYEPMKKYIEDDGRLYLDNYDGIFLGWNDIQLYKGQ